MRNPELRDGRNGDIPVDGDVMSLVNKANTSVVVEAIGGDGVALAAARQALTLGKTFVTANKVLVARWGDELSKLENVYGGGFYYEAAVGGAAPIVALLRRSIPPFSVSRIRAVLNATSGFVLDRMALGRSISEATSDAQRSGYAEADPSLDLNGKDAEDKARIIAAIVFPERLWESKVSVAGIEGLNHESGGHSGKWRLLAEVGPGHITVAPTRLAPPDPLASLDPIACGAVIETSGGPITVTGLGAGGRPTALALISDLVASLGDK